MINKLESLTLPPLKNKMDILRIRLGVVTQV